MQRRLLLNDIQTSLVRGWWESLQPETADSENQNARRYPYGRKERAILRRAQSLDDLVTNEAVIRLARDLWRRGNFKKNLEGDDKNPEFWYYDRVALAAGVIAHVKKDANDGKTLAASLGSAGEGDRPLMSAIRFKAMQRCRDVEDLFVHLRRAVRLAGGCVDVVQLMSDVMEWQREIVSAGHAGARSVKFSWARDYYLSRKDQLNTEIDTDPEFKS